VVLGGGYAGRSFVKSIDKDQYDVVLIDKSLHKTEKKLFFDRFRVNALTYQPQPNYVDSISENAVVNQFMLLSDAVTTIKGECVNVNEKGKKITLKSDEVLDYDYLVFATGSIPDTNHISMKYSCANSLWYFFKDRGDLETLMTVFNIIGLEDVVIMGGGITGVELASELSKRILDAGGRKSPRVTACEGEALKTVTIIEPGDRLLPKLKESTSKIVTEHLARQKVEILTNAVIKGAEDGFLRVKVSGQEVKFKATIAVWTCGVKSDELAMRCVGHNNVTGTLALHSGTSAADGDSNIFAIGDCNNLLPKSAQNAKQQGAYLASYFNSGFKQSTPQFEFNSQGTMIRLADRIYMDSPVYQGFLPLWVHRVIIGLDI
jgi:NADH dehydrogenase FAD-containing subunit